MLTSRSEIKLQSLVHRIFIDSADKDNFSTVNSLELYSPAPVRSGKTPLSPIANFDSFSSTDYQNSDNDDDFGRSRTQAKILSPFQQCCDRRRSRLTTCHTEIVTLNKRKDRDPFLHAKPDTETQQSKLSKTNGITLKTSTTCANTNSNKSNTSNSNNSNSSSGESSNFSCFIRPPKQKLNNSQSLMTRSSYNEHDSKHDEEFVFRMHARPLSLALDPIAQLDLCPLKLEDDAYLFPKPQNPPTMSQESNTDSTCRDKHLTKCDETYESSDRNNQSSTPTNLSNTSVTSTNNSNTIVPNNNNNSNVNNNRITTHPFVKDPFHPGAPASDHRNHLPNNDSTDPNTDGLIRIRIRPDSHGRFGFNVKGGIDHGMPVIVSRVGTNMPADLCIPRLSEGDQILFINNKDVTGHTHQQVVNFIHSASEERGGVLELLVKPGDYVTDDPNEANHIPDSGDAPALPPRTYQLSVHRSLNRITSNSKHLTSSNQKSNTGPNSCEPNQSNLTNGLVDSVHPLLQSMFDLENGLADRTLLAQFERLPRKKPGLTMTVSRLSENSTKNRYRDISPYDQTRVVLRQGSGDYINASFVNMEFPKSGINLRYIAAQGPMPTTYGDFWQMCWEQQVSLVVMLTAISERGRNKCHQYWPDPHKTLSFSVGPLKTSTLTVLNDLQLPTTNTDFAQREFDVTQIPNSVASNPLSSGRKSTEKRRVIQLQYISWPDHGVPNDTDQLITFVQRVRRIRGSSQAPIVVHCSAGIGRTGVLIAIETAMNLMEQRQPVKPLELVQHMREQRAMLIQTTGQFQFVCETILKIFQREHAENLTKS